MTVLTGGLPTYVAILVLMGNLAALAGVVLLFRRAGARIGAFAVGLGAGFVLAVLLAIVGFYDQAFLGPVPLILLGLSVPLGIGIAAMALDRVRSLAAMMDIRWLVGIQTYRVTGFAFLAGMWAGVLPVEFAGPAGWGDVLVGLGAPLVALLVLRAPAGRWAAAAWNTLGLADLVMAFTLANLAGAHTGNVVGAVPTTEALTQYPLVLIPTVMVPISVFLHLLTHVRLRRGPVTVSTDEADPRSTENLREQMGGYPEVDEPSPPPSRIP